MIQLSRPPQAAIRTPMMVALLDEVEPVMNLLKEGKLSSHDRKIANISARILSYKFNTISYLMLLDKPDITWENSAAESLYTTLARLFELQERYLTLQMKAGALMDIVEVFASFTQHKKANLLELLIIWLILFEIVFSLAEHFLL